MWHHCSLECQVDMDITLETRGGQDTNPKDPDSYPLPRGHKCSRLLFPVYPNATKKTKGFQSNVRVSFNYCIRLDSRLPHTDIQVFHCKISLHQRRYQSHGPYTNIWEWEGHLQASGGMCYISWELHLHFFSFKSAWVDRLRSTVIVSP